MLATESMAAASGLCSAVTWGAGDFAGGVASRKGNPFTVVLFSQLIGGILLFGMALIFAEVVPSNRQLMMGGLAGIFGVMGLAFLYKGLSQGRMGLVAPLSAVVAAIVPVTFSITVEGFPGWLCMFGFVFAVVAVWFLSAPGDSASIEAGEMKLAMMAGLAFGMFFISIDYASDQAVLWPLVAARVVSLVSLSMLLAITRQLSSPPRGQFVFVALAGVLDAAGNTAFAFSAHLGRLDVAAILASLYPASTVFLAWWIFRERLGVRQWLGVGFTCVALVLIAI